MTTESPVLSVEAPKTEVAGNGRKAKKKAGAVLKTRKAGKKAASAASSPANKCMCGCGGKTGSRFVPGHDARLKGILKSAYRNGGLTSDQKKLVSSLGWERFITPADARGDSISETDLTIPQINVLRILKRVKAGLTRPEISEAIEVSVSMIHTLGPKFKEDIEATEKAAGRRTLLGRGYVKAVQEDKNGRDRLVYQISASGIKALDRIK